MLTTFSDALTGSNPSDDTSATHKVPSNSEPGPRSALRAGEHDHTTTQLVPALPLGVEPVPPPGTEPTSTTMAHPSGVDVLPGKGKVAAMIDQGGQILRRQILRRQTLWRQTLRRQTLRRQTLRRQTLRRQTQWRQTQRRQTKPTTLPHGPWPEPPRGPVTSPQ